jgi:hypothetical protein
MSTRRRKLGKARRCHLRDSTLLKTRLADGGAIAGLLRGWKMGDLPIDSNTAGSGHAAQDRVVAEAPPASPGKTSHQPAPKAAVSPGHWASKQEVETEYNHIDDATTELSLKLDFLKKVDKMSPTPARQAERERDLAVLAEAGKTELGPAEILSAKSFLTSMEFEDAERKVSGLNKKPENTDQLKNAKQALHEKAEANLTAAKAAADAWKGLAETHRGHSAIDGAIRETSRSANEDLAKAAERKTDHAGTAPKRR